MAETQIETNTGQTPKATMRIQYYRSVIQAPVKHKLVVKGLGFTRLQQIVDHREGYHGPAPV
jgi:hypothetical protein